MDGAPQASTAAFSSKKTRSARVAVNNALLDFGRPDADVHHTRQILAAHIIEISEEGLPKYKLLQRTAVCHAYPCCIARLTSLRTKRGPGRLQPEPAKQGDDRCRLRTTRSHSGKARESEPQDVEVWDGTCPTADSPGCTRLLPRFETTWVEVKQQEGPG